MNVNSKEERRKRIANFREDAIRIAQKNLFGPLANLAEDAAQTSLLKALEREPNYKGSMDKFEGWLYTIVKNTCKDMGRKKREELTSEGDLANFSSKKLSESNYFSRRTEKLKALRTAVHSLSGKDKKIILLRDYFRMSGKEIAQFLEMPPGSVNVYYMRAKAKLRNIYIDKKKPNLTALKAAK